MLLWRPATYTQAGIALFYLAVDEPELFLYMGCAAAVRFMEATLRQMVAPQQAIFTHHRPKTVEL